MKYCLRFNKNSKFLDTVEELMITVHPKHTEASLLKFLKDRPAEQRVLINISGLTIEKVKEIYKWRAGDVHSSFAFVIAPEHPAPAAPFFYNYYVNNWEKLVACVKAGASDVYITDELGFDLSRVSDYCKKHNVKIRVLPNVAQSSSVIEATKSIQKFFIRPDDEYAYENYVDVFEIFGELKRQDVLYKIYKSHEWYGPLSLIINNFTEIIPNNVFLPYFPASRIKCKKKCLQGRCDLCNAMESFGAVLGMQETIKVVYPDSYKGLKENDIVAADKLSVVDDDFDNL